MADHPITVVLERAERNEPGASEELWSLVYDELKRIASARLGAMRPGQTIQATALVHEAWVRLEGASGPSSWDSRAHFFGAAARSMRNILVDQARAKQRLKRNSGDAPDTYDADLVADHGAEAVDMLALDEALKALSAEFERPAQIVSLRYFTGLELNEIAEMLGVTPRTVQRDFKFAKTWLKRQLDRE